MTIEPNTEIPINKIVENLKRELHESRQAILRLAPDDIQSILQGYLFCNTREAAREWEREVIQKVIAIATVRSNGENAICLGQAPCPLCRRSSTSPYQSGYHIPTGLLRHLSGRGHAQKCDVMIAVLGLSREVFGDM